MEPVSNEPPRPPRRFPWVVLILSATIVVLVAFLLLAFLKTGRGVKNVADRSLALAERTIDKAPEIARNFKTGTITQTFRESIPQIASTGGDVLELAVLRSDETFQRADERRIAWDWVYLGTTVAEIRVPVTFRYHLRLSDPWRLATRGQVCLVLAPRIRPSQPPAIHTDRMEKRAESGWARFDKEEQVEKLHSDLTGLLEQRATDSSHLRLVREECRKSVAAFVRNWLLREEHWRKDRFTSITVVFPDEISIDSDEALSDLQAAPTLQLPLE